MTDTRYLKLGYSSVDFDHSNRLRLDLRFSDQSLEQRVRELLGEVCLLLKEHGEIELCKIEVTVNQGIVTLQGVVGKQKVKRLAENIARSIKGVNKVSNQLQVKKCQNNQSQAQSHSHLAIVSPPAKVAIT